MTTSATPTLLALPLGPQFVQRPACAGRAPLFDAQLEGETEQQRDARHARAIAVCQGCPARPECEAEVADREPGYRGVWAARVLTTK